MWEEKLDEKYWQVCWYIWVAGHEQWCDQGVVRGGRERYVAECCLKECKGRMEKKDA